MKKLILFTIAVISCAFCSETKSFRYTSIGTTMIGICPLVSLGIGHRTHEDDFGVDLALSLKSFLILNFLEGEVARLEYFQNNKSYWGLGMSAKIINSPYVRNKLGFAISPKLCIGHEYDNKFNEVAIFFPHLTEKTAFLFPLLSYRFGIEF